MAHDFTRKNFSGWRPTSRSRLLDALARAGIVPRYGTVVAHHVTHRYPNRDSAPRASLAVVGYVCGDGVEALVVAVDGNTKRTDGKTYHMTLSLDGDHKPAESNDLIARTAVTVIDPIAFDTVAF